MLQCVFAKPDMEISVVNDSMEDILGKKKNKKTNQLGSAFSTCTRDMFTHTKTMSCKGKQTHHTVVHWLPVHFYFFLYKIQKSKCHNFSVDTSSKSTPSYTHLNSMSKLLINIFSIRCIYIHTYMLPLCLSEHSWLPQEFTWMYYETFSTSVSAAIQLCTTPQSGCFCNYESVTFSCYVFATLCVCVCILAIVDSVLMIS